jgi:DNA repair exonuclease SbcCD ATPase subunit
MKLFLGLIALVCAIVLGVGVWIGPEKLGVYNSVVHSDVVAAIDNRLGDVRIRKAEAHQRVVSLSQAVEHLREGQIASEVKAEQLAKRADRVASLQARVESSLKRLRELISANAEASLGGKTYSPQQLNELGERVATAAEAVRGQRAALEQAQRMLVETSRTLQGRWEQGRTALGSLQDQLTLVDSKIEALGYLRDAATVAGATDGSLAGQFKKVQNDLDTLYAKVETGLRIEEDRWKSDPLTGTPNIDPLLKELWTTESTLARIDALLGQGATKGGASEGGAP